MSRFATHKPTTPDLGPDNLNSIRAILSELVESTHDVIEEITGMGYDDRTIKQYADRLAEYKRLLIVLGGEA